MNWLGVIVLGGAIALFGRALHPSPGARRASWGLVLLAGVLGAAGARMIGNLGGYFYDGETLEWPVCAAAALLAVVVTAGLARR
jgi:hypothetical protein